MGTVGWKTALALFCCVISASSSAAHGMEMEVYGKAEEKCHGSGIVVMFWNLENFFDYKDDGTGASDAEFTPSGARHWTAGRFYSKCRAIAKTILWVSDRYGKLPDIIGFAEVENRSVLVRLLSATALRKCGYKIVHRDSPDHRGIDVALLWRKESLTVTDFGFKRIEGMNTREILYVRGKTATNDSDMSFIVTHFPSKYGGGGTDVKRLFAAQCLRSLCDSLASEGAGRIITMGDFNDVSSSSAFDPLREVLVNAETTLSGAPCGTIRYNGRWEQIDMFWSSSGFGVGEKFEVLRVPFLMTTDNVYSGEKPLRTYSGPRYLGGASDHCPIILQLTAE